MFTIIYIISREQLEKDFEKINADLARRPIEREDENYNIFMEILKSL